MPWIELLGFGLDIIIMFVALGYAVYSERPLFSHVGRVVRMFGFFVVFTILFYFAVLVGVTALTGIN